MLPRISRLFHSWASGWLILALTAAFVVYLAVTLPVLQAAPGGSIVSLDTQLFYSPEEAFSTIGSYGASKNFWIRTQLTWDIVNPILYSFSLVLFISWLFQRSFKPGSKIQVLNVVPLGAGLFDLLENFSIVFMLSTYPSEYSVVAWLSAVCTFSKALLLGMSIIFVLVGVVAAASRGFKKG